jgi:hypothetical protein
MERYFMIFNVSEIDKINYSQTLTTSNQSLRMSVDGTKTFVKWEGENVPEFLNEFTTKEGPYNFEQMLTIIESSEWTVPYGSGN